MLTKKEMDAIGKEYGIHPRYRKEFLKLANEGKIDNDDFGSRLTSCQNYKRACVAVMELMSRELEPV